MGGLPGAGVTLSALGTHVRMAIRLDDALPAAEALLRRELAAVDEAVGRHAGDRSDVARVNRFPGEHVPVGLLLLDLLDEAILMAELTSGSVRPTVAAVSGSVGNVAWPVTVPLPRGLAGCPREW